MILHVRDIAGPDSAAEAEDVRQVLAQLGLDEHPDRLIEVWNKIDQLDPESRALVEVRARRSGEDGVPACPISALTGEGEAALLSLIATRVDDAPPLQLVLSAGEGEALAWVYRNGRVVARREDEEGVTRLAVRLDAQALGRLERLFPHVMRDHAV